MREFTKTTQRPSSETPLSVTHRPEALRHRLAPGMPLNEREYIMRCAIEHAVVVHRQAQRFRTQKCDSVPTNRECESGAEAMCRCRFGVYKKGFSSFEDCRSKSPSTAARRGGKKRRDVKYWFALFRPPQNPGAVCSGRISRLNLSAEFIA